MFSTLFRAATPLSCPTCTAQCDSSAQQVCTRTVITPAAYKNLSVVLFAFVDRFLFSNGGKACSALTETRLCFGPNCPRDCVTSDWQCDDCLGACGSPGTLFASNFCLLPFSPQGKRYCTKSVLTASQFGGKSCPALTKVEACPMNPCPVDCKGIGLLLYWFSPSNSWRLHLRWLQCCVWTSGKSCVFSIDCYSQCTRWCCLSVIVV